MSYYAYENGRKFEAVPPPKFRETKAFKSADLNVPVGFKAGSVVFSKKKDDGIDNLEEYLNKLGGRVGFGNYDLKPTEYYAPPIKAREYLSYEKAQLLDLQTKGIKVQLGDQFFKEMFKLIEPDPTDLLWLAEEKRLLGTVNPATGVNYTKDDLKINKPLGRDQRTIERMSNPVQALSQFNISVESKLDLLKNQVVGLATTTQNVQNALTALTPLITNIDTLTIQGFTDIKTILTSIRFPMNRVMAGLQNRFYDKKEYIANQAQLIMYIINMTSDADIKTNKYVLNTTSTKGVNKIDFTSFVGKLKAPDPGKLAINYLDLNYNNTTQIAIVDSKYAVGEQGNNGFLSGIDLKSKFTVSIKVQSPEKQIITDIETKLADAITQKTLDANGQPVYRNLQTAEDFIETYLKSKVPPGQPQPTQKDIKNVMKNENQLRIILNSM